MITSELLEAYLACPMKCYLQLIGERRSENKFATWYQAPQESYRTSTSLCTTATVG
jgi:hypothetical protein